MVKIQTHVLQPLEMVLTAVGCVHHVEPDFLVATVSTKLEAQLLAVRSVAEPLGVVTSGLPFFLDCRDSCSAVVVQGVRLIGEVCHR